MNRGGCGELSDFHGALTRALDCQSRSKNGVASLAYGRFAPRNDEGQNKTRGRLRRPRVGPAFTLRATAWQVVRMLMSRHYLTGPAN
jgi:hypothetical protein